MKDINVYGPIGDAWSDDAVRASDFANALKDADGDDVTIHINSGGGDVFDANTMAETLRAYKGRSIASIEGLAASAASYFALTADEVVINPSALVMIHNPYCRACGDADDMRKTADMLDKVRGTISGQYARKTGKEASEIEELMDAETWFTADDAIEFGLADRMSDAEPVAACVDASIMKGFKHAPKTLTSNEDAAGEPGQTIEKNASAPKAGAAEGAAGAAASVVCVNGAFLKVGC